MYIKSPITCIQVNQFLMQKNGKHFIDISIVSKGEDFLKYKLTIVIAMLSINTNNIARYPEPREFIFKYPQKIMGGETALTILINTRPSLTVML